MKLKEKWAEESNPYDDVHDYEEHGTWPSAWLAGFEFAKKECGRLLGDWEGIRDDSFKDLGEEKL